MKIINMPVLICATVMNKAVRAGFTKLHKTLMYGCVKNPDPNTISVRMDEESMADYIFLLQEIIDNK